MAENRNQDSMFNQNPNDMNNQSQNVSNPSGSEGREGSGNERRKSNRGFAAMDPEKQREIARQGGRAAHQKGVAHEWTSEEAREAGRKGGHNSHGGGRRGNSEGKRDQ